MVEQNYKLMNDWSETEKQFAHCLDQRGIKYKFEPMTIDIIDNFDGTMGRQKATFYTPDFAFKIGEITYIIEVKGFARPRDYLIWKLADQVFARHKNYKFIPITISGTKQKNNRDFYFYHQKGIPKRGLKSRTFWETIGLQPSTGDLEFKTKIKLWEALGIK